MSLADEIEKIHLTNFVLAGHSLGGYIAGNYALKHPQHVSKLILLSPIGIRPELSKSEFSKKTESFKYPWNNSNEQ